MHERQQGLRIVSIIIMVQPLNTVWLIALSVKVHDPWLSIVPLCRLNAGILPTALKWPLYNNADKAP